MKSMKRIAVRALPSRVAAFGALHARPGAGRRATRGRLPWIVGLVASVGGATMLYAAPAQAAYPKTSYNVEDTRDADPGAAGDFIWYNRSVRVGGTVVASADNGSVCAAVVFTGRDGGGNIVARAARPGDNSYTCSAFPGFSYGFTLDASTVVGGIRTIEVDLWEKYEGSTFEAVAHTYRRP
jgi:hypothetical protein